MMNSKEIKQRVQEWVTYCAESGPISRLPYIDAQLEIEGRVEEFLGIVRKDSNVTGAWRDALEQQLLRDPANRALRVAALYPFQIGGLSNPYETSFGQLRRAFCHLAGLCVPERLISLEDSKFELYNLYLAANWDQGSEILHRISVLDLLPAHESYLLRAQFWFLSVFGRRIEFELLNRQFEYDLFWPARLPEPRADADEVARALFVFARPEILTWGSPAHWALTAWCTNPRAPKPVPLEPGPLFVGDPDEPRTEQSGAMEGPEESMRKYIHDQYREFDPIAPPELSQRQRTRLLVALRDLREGLAIDQDAGRPYLPILARTLFCLGRFDEAAETYSALEKQGLVFKNVVTGEEDSDWEWELCFHRCLCLKGAGKHDAAIHALGEFGERRKVQLPDPVNKTFLTWGTGWWIAKWYSEQGRYQEAAQFLKAELESFYSPPESWQLSTILVLESVVREQEGPAETARQYIAGRPDIQQIMSGTILDFWPMFGTLSQESRLRWLTAVHLSFAECPLKDARGIWLNNAVREYGWVLEYELKTKLFSVFRSEVESDRDRRARVLADSHEDLQDEFYRFLTRKPEITLGAMVAAIKQSQASHVQTDIYFAAFLQTHSPQLVKSTAALKTALQLRNRATHDNRIFDSETVREMAISCRAVLDCLIRK